MDNTRSIFKLNGVVQHYSWGGNHFIPALLSLPQSGEKPFAEYWLGAHQNAPSVLTTAEGQRIENLDRFISSDSRSILGNEVNHQFGRLPYLLKVLDVKDMLSIQVHPSKASAKEGYERENLKGVPVNDLNRNYKDDNHKPELMVALSEFWLLHGFKPETEIVALFQRVPELAFLHASFEQTGYLGMYQVIMEMPQERVDEVLQPLLERIIPAYQNNELTKTDEHFWAARAATTFHEPGKTDRGIFSIYVFNLVHINEGQAIFQDAGIPHAYLEGQNMEIMANSDNVLRGGLTNKHIDVSELLRHTRFEPTTVKIIEPVPSINDGELLYLSPAADFQLSRFELRDKSSSFVNTASGEVFFVYDGSAIIKSGDDRISVSHGESVFAVANAGVSLEGTPQAVIFRASVPVSRS